MRSGGGRRWWMMNRRASVHWTMSAWYEGDVLVDGGLAGVAVFVRWGGVGGDGVAVDVVEVVPGLVGVVRGWLRFPLGWFLCRFGGVRAAWREGIVNPRCRLVGGLCRFLRVGAFSGAGCVFGWRSILLGWDVVSAVLAVAAVGRVSGDCLRIDWGCREFGRELFGRGNLFRTGLQCFGVRVGGNLLRRSVRLGIRFVLGRGAVEFVGGDDRALGVRGAGGRDAGGPWGSRAGVAAAAVIRIGGVILVASGTGCRWRGCS